MKRDYETTVVFDANLDEAKINAEIEKIAAIVTAHGGSIKKTMNAGKKKLAYRVNRRDFGIYVLLVHDGENTLVAALERALEINENIIRHLIVKRDKLAPEGELVIAEDFVQVFGDEEGLGSESSVDLSDEVDSIA